MQLLVVIVNYRTADLTVECLRALKDDVAALSGVRVVVTDNASGDDSARVIGDTIASQGWDEWATLIPLEHNGGFAYGNNAAIRPALSGDDPPQYVLLLNPDTYIRPGALSSLLAFMNAHPEAGIAGSRLENPDTTVQCSAFRFHNVIGEFTSTLRLGIAQKLLGRWTISPTPRKEAHRSDWVSGACMIIRGQVFNDIGLLDENYFMYYEETDFCLRSHRAGWECWYVPDCRVVHLVGQASNPGTTSVPMKPRPRYWFASRAHYFTKLHGRAYKVLADLAWTSGFALWRLRRWLFHKPDTDPPNLLRDFVRFNFMPQRPREQHPAESPQPHNARL